MSDRSPLFIGAAELLSHSVELFRQVDERKYKFVILHLANAVELLLQDRLIDAGESIYEPTKPVTVSIWRILDSLKKLRVKIPERPVIEFLVEDRNTVHHRLGYPELKTVYYYLDEVTAFFKRFLRDEYGIELADVLKELGISEGDLQLLGVLEGQGNEQAFLDKLFELSPDSAILQAFKFIEGKFSELFFIQDGYLELKARKPLLLAPQRSSNFEQLLDGLVEGKFLTRKLVNKLDTLRTARNYAVYHDASGNDTPDWAEALKIAKDVLAGLNKAIEAGYSAEVEENIPADIVVRGNDISE
jgi:hypothetical protein